MTIPTNWQSIATLVFVFLFTPMNGKVFNSIQPIFASVRIVFLLDQFLFSRIPTLQKVIPIPLWQSNGSSSSSFLKMLLFFPVNEYLFVHLESLNGFSNHNLVNNIIKVITEVTFCLFVLDSIISIYNVFLFNKVKCIITISLFSLANKYVLYLIEWNNWLIHQARKVYKTFNLQICLTNTYRQISFEHWCNYRNTSKLNIYSVHSRNIPNGSMFPIKEAPIFLEIFYWLEAFFSLDQWGIIRILSKKVIILHYVWDYFC